MKISRSSLLQLLSFAAVAGGLVAAWKLLPLNEWLAEVQAQVRLMGAWAFVVYPFIMTACSLLMLPGSIFVATAGILFGLWWGTVMVLAGNLIGAAIAFFLSRRFGRRWLERRFLSQPRWKAMDEAIGREGWKIIFFSQLHPLSPTSFLNYLYGVTRIQFRPCMLWILLGQIPGVFLYVYIGTLAQMGLKTIQGKGADSGDYLVWSLGLAATVAISVLLGKVALKVLNEAQQVPELPSGDEPPSL